MKTAENGGFCEECLNENYFEAVLATVCCYDYSVNASEAFQKMATDQKGYQNCQAKYINKQRKTLVTRTPP